MIAIVASAAQTTLVHLSTVDLVIIAFYFALVLGIGFYLKRFAKTGEDFFLAGREMTAWVAGLAFVSANLGSLELLGWAGSAYQYGILAAHWYWIGAIPAMVFLGIVMMPFYYISKTHSVPGYLQLRYGPAASALSAVTFAIMTILMSGVNMYAMAVVMKVVLGWDINFSIWVSSLTVAIYVTLGGLRSAIFNEVLQFFLIWAGALLISGTATGSRKSKAICAAVKRILWLSAQHTWVAQLVCSQCSEHAAIKSFNFKIVAPRDAPSPRSTTTLTIAAPCEVFAFVNRRTLFFVRQ